MSEAEAAEPMPYLLPQLCLLLSQPSILTLEKRCLSASGCCLLVHWRAETNSGLDPGHKLALQLGNLCL